MVHLFFLLISKILLSIWRYAMSPIQSDHCECREQRLKLRSDFLFPTDREFPFFQNKIYCRTLLLNCWLKVKQRCILLLDHLTLRSVWSSCNIE
jgi:hypothetical protein